MFKSINTLYGILIYNVLLLVNDDLTKILDKGIYCPVRVYISKVISCSLIKDDAVTHFPL